MKYPRYKILSVLWSRRCREESVQVKQFGGKSPHRKRERHITTQEIWEFRYYRLECGHVIPTEWASRISPDGEARCLNCECLERDPDMEVIHPIEELDIFSEEPWISSDSMASGRKGEG